MERRFSALLSCGRVALIGAERVYWKNILIVRTVNANFMKRNALDGVASGVFLSIIYAYTQNCYCCTENGGKPFTFTAVLANVS
jgi:hypothetical protein